jgi:hypothetical protein
MTKLIINPKKFEREFNQIKRELKKMTPKVPLRVMVPVNVIEGLKTVRDKRIKEGRKPGDCLRGRLVLEAVEKFLFAELIEDPVQPPVRKQTDKDFELKNKEWSEYLKKVLDGTIIFKP